MLKVFIFSLALSYLAFALMACAMGRHRDDILGQDSPEPSASSRRWLHIAAAVLLLGALGLAIGLAGPAFGALLWSLQISMAAMLVAFTLTWRPRCLAPLLRLLMA